MAEGEEMDRGEPIAAPLVLRHASKRSSGTWGPDDYDPGVDDLARPCLAMERHAW
jgi:hypothetical protein